jgi:hypothetical protein
MQTHTEKHAYIIVAPPFKRASAGIKGMHLLAEHLHQKGFEVYIHARTTLPQRKTPRLTRRALFNLNRNSKAPIVVYAETLWGNPLRASCVVRYAGNFLGKLGGPKSFADSELLVWHTSNLSEGKRGLVLTIPVTDTTHFYAPPKDSQRDITSYYAMKFKHAHGGKVEDYISLPEGCIEITRDQPDSQTPQQIGEILRRSKVFYAFENTALSLEAMVCGCPVQLVPSSHFEAPILVEPFGLKGMAWGFEAGEWERAVQTLPEVTQGLELLETQFANQLNHFIKDTQEHAWNFSQTSKLEWSHPYPIESKAIHYKLLRFLSTITGMFRHHGFRTFAILSEKAIRARSWRDIKRILRQAELAPETFIEEL